MFRRGCPSPRVVILASACWLCLTGWSCRETPADPRPAAPPEPKPTASSPAESAPENSSVSPAARAILDRLERAGDTFVTLRADLEYEVRNAMTGETELRTGTVAYQKETADQPAKFRVNFQTLRLEEGPVTRQRVEYLFDGRFVIKDQYATKTRTCWQVAAEGQRVEALRIGKGPFPIPFGQKTRDVLELLHAGTRPAESSDPPNTDFLLLSPLPGREKDVNFTRLEMWVDRRTNLPVKLRARDENQTVKTVVFSHIQTNPKIDPKLFDEPRPAGFELIVERLER